MLFRSAFARSIPPSRLACIKHITINYDRSTDSGGNYCERYRHRYAHEDFFTLIYSMPRLGNIELDYSILFSYGIREMQQDAIELLEAFAEKPERAGCEVWYNISVYWGRSIADWKNADGTDKVLLYERWRVGERVRVSGGSTPTQSTERLL